MMRDIIVATGNAGKLREIRAILRDLPCSLTSLAEHFAPLPSIPETGDTFLANAILKAQWVFDRKNTWVLADDSGLEVDALGGRPGVWSARFAGENSTGDENNRKLLGLLSQQAGPRTARFKCVMVLMTAPDAVFPAEGACEGVIVDAPRGKNGFGYDPLFVPDGFSRTFAELDDKEKNAISHRSRALQRIKTYCNELIH